MHFMRNNKIQKLSTTFLLVVLVFINAVKSFHTHNFSYLLQTEKSTNNSAAVKAAFSCAICDFQIAKDTDVEVASIHIDAPTHYIITFYSYRIPSLSKFIITSSVRGPPYNYC